MEVFKENVYHSNNIKHNDNEIGNKSCAIILITAMIKR